MKPILFVWLLANLPLAAVTSTTTLTLVNDANFNKVTVKVDPGFGLADTKTTTLTGTVQARLGLDPQAATTSELTLSNGRCYGTNMTFAKSIIFVGGYNVTVANLSAAVYTITPPGVVTPATGQFAAEQHAFVIDQGTIKGSTSGALIGNNPIDQTFTPENPASGTGSGTGTVTLVPAGDSGGFRTFNVTVTLPIAISDSFPASGLTVNLTATGTMKATGTVQVPLGGYSPWAQQISNASLRDFEGDADTDGLPNGLEYVLNGNPSAPGDAGILPLLDYSGATSVKFTYFCKTSSTADTVQTVQYRGGATGWTDIAVSPTPAAGVLVQDQGGSISKVTVTIGRLNPRMLVRLKVTQP